MPNAIMRALVAVGLASAWLAAAPARSQPAIAAIPLVAAENFYGDVAKQIGGPGVRVTSILSNPDQDPHIFEASPSVARAISAAKIVVYSGIDYDPWMAKLLGAARNPDRTTIVVADLVGRKPGDNPHIWYDPATMLALTRTLADTLGRIDPAHQAEYQNRLQLFQASVAPIQAEIAGLRSRLTGTPATATEPIFGYMFDLLGMQVRNQSFQLAVMNDTEPSTSDVAGFENDLKTHKVALLIYNSQASDPIAARMERLARASHIPVVAATETEPPGKTYQAWMTSQLDALEAALTKPGS
jgi:zinc/manganese transport system substrate-binding protein